MRRIRLAGALGLLAILAFELAAMRGESDLWQSGVFTLTLAILSVASLGALLKRGRGPGWVGFAVFGWIYFLAVAAGSELITTHALDGIYSAVFKPPKLPIVGGKQLTREEISARPGIPDPQSAEADYLLRDGRYGVMRDRFTTIGHWFLCVVSGFFGVLAGVALDPRRSPATQRGTRGPLAVIAGAPADGAYERA
ncbi:MAG TPA: hypothetical protein VG406_21345 [Isosphaeraceae bacterium]|jgi:hypothetical protein|nr:hypothetical protein [Isosphaeraceae bacterium]